jgi:tetratricopeptide (TPR) repeat protein
MGPTLDLWLDRLDQEHDNLRQALRHGLDVGDARAVLRIGAALSRFWSVRGHFREGWRWLEQALALPGADALDAAVRARALGAAGILARAGNEYARAEALFEAGLAAARQTAENALLAEALNNVGGAARAQGDAKRAMALFEEALALPGIKAYPRTVVHTLFNLSMVARDAEDYTRAQALLQQCLALQAVLGDRQARAVTLNILASVASATGDHARAQALHQEGLDLQQAMGHKRGVAVSYSFMCVEAAATGDVARAADLGRRALMACREIGERWNTAECLGAIARIAWLQDRPRQVARLLGAADRLRDGSRVPAQHRLAETQLADAVRDRLGPGVYEVGWTEGRALTFDGAVELGLAAAGDAARQARRVSEGAPAGVRSPVPPPALPELRLPQRHRTAQE